MRRLIVATLVCLIFATAAAAQTLSQARTEQKPAGRAGSKDFTLGELRSLLLGKKVIIGGTVSKISRLRDDLLYWIRARQQGERYEETREIDRHLPASYVGQEAEVIAVQLNSLDVERRGGGRTNALGETVNDDAITDPYVDVVVRLPDGTLAMTTSYPISLLSEYSAPFRLSSESKARSAEINDQLPSIVGKTVYAVGFSKLYEPTTGLEELAAGAPYSESRVPLVPKLKPLTIAAAKFNAERDLIVLKLRDGEGKEYLTASTYRGFSKEQSFLDRVVWSSPANLITTLTKFTPREIEAIRGTEIYHGMRKLALDYALGFPDKKNGWGRGGQQLIYFGGAPLRLPGRQRAGYGLAASEQVRRPHPPGRVSRRRRSA